MRDCLSCFDQPEVEFESSSGHNRQVGITLTKAKISNPRKPLRRPALELEFLIDTGAIYSVVPGSIARKLALTKLDREEFTPTERTAPMTSGKHSSNSPTGAAPQKWSSVRRR